jgi:hypothetical protein
MLGNGYLHEAREETASSRVSNVRLDATVGNERHQTAELEV